MIRSAELNTEHLTDEDEELNAIVWLRNAGYPVDILERHPVVSVKDDEDNTGYLVTKIQTLARHPDVADAVEDEIEVHVCHCWNFVDEHMPNLSDGGVPTDISECKHIEDVDKTARAQNDQNQRSLFDTPVGNK